MSETETATSSPVEPITEKTTHAATAAEVKRADVAEDAPGELPVSPKETAIAAGEIPVSGSVEKGDEVVRRNDAQGTLGPVAGAPLPFMSEGVRAEIEMRGSSVDPMTGKRLTRDDLPAKPARRRRSAGK